MTKRNGRAGGFLLIAPILIGFGWGIATGQASKGVLTGTVIGIGLALLLWLLDRRSGDRRA